MSPINTAVTASPEEPRIIASRRDIFEGSSADVLYDSINLETPLTIAVNTILLMDRRQRLS